MKNTLHSIVIHSIILMGVWALILKCLGTEELPPSPYHEAPPRRGSKVVIRSHCKIALNLALSGMHLQKDFKQFTFFSLWFVSFWPFETVSYIVQPGLELLMLPPPPLNIWDYKYIYNLTISNSISINSYIFVCLNFMLGFMFGWFLLVCLIWGFILFLIKMITVNLMVCGNLNEKHSKKGSGIFASSHFISSPVSGAFRQGYGGAALLEKVHPLETVLRVRVCSTSSSLSDSSLSSKMGSLSFLLLSTCCHVYHRDGTLSLWNYKSNKPVLLKNIKIN